MPSPHILIIGGGVGGLALAQGLKKNGISFTLFERDSSPAARSQGYRIRVAGGGSEGLHECLDDDMWSLFEKTCAEIKPGASRFNAINTNSKEPLFPGSGPPPRGHGPNVRPGVGGMQIGPGASKAYTVDRTMLRSLLLLGQKGHVKFGKRFTRYEITPSGVTAFFSDGTSEEGTLLVSAEGVESLVRKQLLPHHRYIDTGSRAIYGKTPFTEELKERFHPEASKQMTIIQDPKPLTLFLEPIHFPNDACAESHGQLPKTEDYVYLVFAGSVEDFVLSDKEFHALAGKAAADLTLKLTEHWDPSYRAMFELQNTDQCAPLRLISAKPERPEWSPSTRVTLLGDAVHAMMPAGGSGANCALADAALLLRLIVETGISEDMMGRYINEMMDYAVPAIEGSAQAGHKLLGFKGFEGAKEVDI